MNKRVGYFGDETSYTYACTIENFRGANMQGFSTIRAVAESVNNGVVDCAIVPIENSMGGLVCETLDALKKYGVYITRQYFLPISHSLIAMAGADKREIKRVYAHCQGLAQCEEYLMREFPNAKMIISPSTAEALRSIKQRDEAAIARLPLPGQTVLENDIQDEKSSVIRFALLEKEPNSEGKIVSVVFDAGDKSGSLFLALEIIKEYGFNLNKIESRKNWGDDKSSWIYTELTSFESIETLIEMERKLNDLMGFAKLLGAY